MSCTITGSGSNYSVGRIITGAEAFTIDLRNDTTTVTTEIAAVYSNYFTIWMQIQDGGSFPAFDPQYGCWGYFYRSGVITDVFEVEIIENSAQAVEILLRCNNYAFGATVEGVTSARVWLRIRVEDGKQGVFLGWHSSPSIGPDPLSKYNDTENNNPEYGERELGTGGGSAVVWSSAGEDYVFRYPAWGQRAEWDTAEAILGPISNRAAWCGIDDAEYSIYGTDAFAATQIEGFPTSQDSAPWWCADISVNNPVCRYIVMRKPIETGVWQFNPVHAGSLVCHFNNEWYTDDYRTGVFPFQIFIGAFHYIADSSSGYINEPSSTVKAEVLARIQRLEWPYEQPRKWLSDTAVVSHTGTHGLRYKRKRRYRR